MATFFKGDEIKFAITLEAEGFSMDTDDFDIEVKSGNTSIKGYQGVQKEESSGIVIFKEGDAWYAIADTAGLATGTMRVIATAHIPDANANDGIRKNIAVQPLGQLKDA